MCSAGRVQVHVLGALPLRNMSRVWGYVNSFELPVWIRPYSFRVYAYIFGCNLEEIDPGDLTQYASLGEFFYRKLKDGARPIDDAILVRIYRYAKISTDKFSRSALLTAPSYISEQ
jgi:phosphatidylserine decarboxylase